LGYDYIPPHTASNLRLVWLQCLFIGATDDILAVFLQKREEQRKKVGGGVEKEADIL
jgi:hypothetical protein